MKVTLIANVSLNGRILLSDDPHHQLPAEAMAFYLDFSKQVGHLVVGYKTFQNFMAFPQEIRARFDGIEIVILSDRAGTADGYKICSSPEEVIAYMQAKGVKEMAIGGGTNTFNAFIDKDLVTDIYLNINPMITGSGGIFVGNKALHTHFHLGEYTQVGGFIRQHFVKEK